MKPDRELIAIASEVSSKIEESGAIYRFAHCSLQYDQRMTRDKSNILLKSLTEVVEKIASPYEKASALLDIIPLILQNSDDAYFLIFLKKSRSH